MKSGFARAVRKVGPITGPAHARPCKAWNFMAILVGNFEAYAVIIRLSHRLNLLKKKKKGAYNIFITKIK